MGPRSSGTRLASQRMHEGQVTGLEPEQGDVAGRTHDRFE